jgi:hypothetical protein
MVRYTYSGLAVSLRDRKFDKRVQSHLNAYAEAGWRLVSTGQRDEEDTVEFSFFWEAGTVRRAE